MTARTLRLGIALVASLGFTAAAGVAQIDPDDTGTGYKLGIQQQSNSGEVGSVTMFRRNKGLDTLIVLELMGEPAGRHQPAHIHRGKACDELDPKPAYPLAPVTNGVSRTIVHAPEAKLLSGNYSIVVHADDTHMQQYVACGNLYQS